MEIVYDNESLERYMKTAVKVSNDSPVLLDSFLDHAIEVDIDVISDGKDIVIGGDYGGTSSRLEFIQVILHAPFHRILCLNLFLMKCGDKSN